MTETVTPKPAATVVLVRDRADSLQVLLLRRNSKLDFAGGSWVFPGGRIEESDFPVNAAEDIDAAARAAAARETEEEAALQMSADDMVYFAHWTTPPESPKRFATWFFITSANDIEQEVQVDGSEIHEHRWFRPQDALNAQAEQHIELMPPAFVTLTKLAEFTSVAETLAFFSNNEATVYEPHFAVSDDGIVALYPGDAGYESRDLDAEGPRHRLAMLRGEGWDFEFSK